MSADPIDLLAGACPVRPATADDHVDGVPARLVATPTSTAQTSALLRACTAHDLAVVVRGHGTKLTWGRPPERVDVIVETTGMAELVEHSHGDLIATAGAGMPLARLQEVLAGAGHQLVVDDLAAGSTLGGALATRLAGHRRLWAGTLRDLVIGLRLVRADGTVANAGGKVVKNVAGYDLGKLLVGSFGTLAVVTEVTVRLHPRPEHSTWVTTRVGGDRLATVLGELVHSQLDLHALEVHAEAAASTVEIAALLEGTEQGVAARVASLTGQLARLGCPGPAPGEAPAWALAPAPAPTPDKRPTLLRTTARLSGIPELVAHATGLGLEITGSAGAGVLHARANDDRGVAGTAAAVEAVRTTSLRLGGSTVVLDAPAPVKAAVDSWGPVGGLALMRRVKAEFDPQRLLAPGRFVGGI